MHAASIVAELRQNGYDIDCQRRGDKWFYRHAHRAAEGRPVE